MEECLKQVSAAQLLGYDPHRFLGLHTTPEGEKVIRLYRPGAPFLYVEVLGKSVEAHRLSEEGLFECPVPSNVTLHDYRVYVEEGKLTADPYAFPPMIGEMDTYLFSRGVHYHLYDILGARLCSHSGVSGTRFAVWAPNAATVSVIGDFNRWDGRMHLMRCLGASGIWELFIPEIQEGEKYKFEIQTKEGKLLLKSDPFSLSTEMRPSDASVVAAVDAFVFTDQKWQESQRARGKNSYPLNIYEVHLGSWKRKEGHPLNYRESAHLLAAYCKEMGFSHIELMPILEHPLDESWGYQVTGFFAVTSRYGTPSDFQYFVNHLHAEGIGVILDWVPAHFPSDPHSLSLFDGTHLFEHADPRKGFHPHWNTSIFNYGRFEVSNFLIASALFWCDKMHIDGLRVDAVASMLYLDYGREEGEWIPNIYGGKENLEAIEFLKHLNAAVHERFPAALLSAEESTSFTGVTHSLEAGGLGFDLKWNMGWMNDSLRYLQRDPLFRTYHQNDLTFALIYAFSEKFLLPLSHDEVVHGKKALLSKMPGDDWQKFANLRLLISYQICQPGKKLLFMGAELGMWDEWNCKEELPWGLLNYERHGKLHRCIKELNHFYRAHSALWEFDFDGRGFAWVDFQDRKNSTLSYLRRGAQTQLFCVHNFTPQSISDYFVPLASVLKIEEVFNTDREEYYGSGKINREVAIITDSQGNRIGVKFLLAPLATHVFEVTFVS